MATVKELREEAKRLGLKGYSRMNKAELEAAIDSRILELREETGKRIAERANINSNPVTSSSLIFTGDFGEKITTVGTSFSGSYLFLSDRDEVVRYASKNSVVPCKVIGALTLIELFYCPEEDKILIDLKGSAHIGAYSIGTGKAFEAQHGYVSNIQLHYVDPVYEIDFSDEPVDTVFSPAVSEATITEQPQPEQPAVVKLDVNPYSGYFCGYDAERIAFLNRVKNGHVPQSVLAELSPEDYAQVMQEVNDMKKKEQEQERSQQAQDEQATPAEARNTEQEQPQPETPAVVEAPTPIVEQPQPETPTVTEQPAPANPDDDDDPDPTPPSNGGKSHANPNYGTVRGMTTRELREAAKTLDIKGYAKMNRAQLVEALSKNGRFKPARRAYDYSLCYDPARLRSALKAAPVETLEVFARNLKGKTIQLPDDEKLITKAFLVDAIVRAYFPNAQETPASTRKPVPVPQHVFELGRQYYKGFPDDITEINAVTILERNGDYITIREEDTGFISRKKIRVTKYYPSEYAKLSNYEHDVVYSTAKLFPDPVPITSPKFPRLFQKVQRALIRETMTIAGYMQPKPQPLALPAVVEHQEAPVQEVRHEAWQDHICEHCNHSPTWTHEQFTAGILLAREYRKSSSKDSRKLWLARECNLAQIYRLAMSLGLNIPTIELTSDNSKSHEKKLQIASIIWSEITNMEHVYVCTYQIINPPALPVELVEHQDAQATSQKVNDCILAPELVTKCIKSEHAQRVVDNAYCKKQREAMGLGNGYDLGFFPDECSPDFFPRIWTKQQLAMAHSIMFWWKQYFFPLPEKIFWEKYRHSVWNNHAYAHSGEGYEGIITLKKYSKKYLLELADDIGLNLHDGKYSRLDMVKLITMECYKATFINYATAPTASEIIDAEFAEPEQLQLENPTVAQEVNYPAPVKKRKSHRNIPTDTSRQILICFDDEETPDAASIQAKPQRRVTRKPRIKRDYSRQLIFVFDEVTDCNTKQRKAA